MKGYIAILDGNAQFLTKSEQMDNALKNGCSIAKVDDDGTETVIATPEKGFLFERPELEKTGTMSNPYAQALLSLQNNMKS